MKAILYSIVILVAVGAAFFTHKHKVKFEALQKDRLETIATNKAVSANAAVEENKYKKESEVLVVSESKRTEVTLSIGSLKDAGSKMERDVAGLDTTLKAQDAEFVELDKTLKEVNKILEALGGGVTIEALPDKILQIEADRKSRIAKLEELVVLAGAAEKLLEKNRAEMDRLVKRDVGRNARIGRNAMEAVITAVDQDWGFLVIGAGSNSGFTPQTSLLVQRDGRMIGRVRPSSIELTQTIAEIDFKSLSSGVRLQPGDHVMLTKPNTN
jgi:hypothetical protein